MALDLEPALLPKPPPPPVLMSTAPYLTTAPYLPSFGRQGKNCSTTKVIQVMYMLYHKHDMKDQR